MGAYSEQALQLLRKMQRRSAEPDVISCSSTISACARGAQPKRALQLREIPRRSVEPDVISCSSTVSTCVKGAQPVQALQLREIQQRSVEPDVISYEQTPRSSWTSDLKGRPKDAEMMGAYSEQALQLPRKMQRQSDEPEVISCSSTISACVKGTQPEQALQLRELQDRKSVV